MIQAPPPSLLVTLFPGCTMAPTHNTQQTERLGLKALIMGVITRIWQDLVLIYHSSSHQEESTRGQGLPSASGLKFHPGQGFKKKKLSPGSERGGWEDDKNMCCKQTLWKRVESGLYDQVRVYYTTLSHLTPSGAFQPVKAFHFTPSGRFYNSSGFSLMLIYPLQCLTSSCSVIYLNLELFSIKFQHPFSWQNLLLKLYQ